MAGLAWSLFLFVIFLHSVCRGITVHSITVTMIARVVLGHEAYSLQSFGAMIVPAEHQIIWSLEMKTYPLCTCLTRLLILPWHCK